MVGSLAPGQAVGKPGGPGCGFRFPTIRSGAAAYLDFCSVKYDHLPTGERRTPSHFQGQWACLEDAIPVFNHTGIMPGNAFRKRYV